MRVVTLNCNGIRAASRKGFFDWLPTIGADVVCLQETKAQVDQLTDPLFSPEGYHCYYYDAEKKGYSGVATLSRSGFERIETGMAGTVDEGDTEGRILVTEHQGFTCINTYLPSGSNKQERQEFKDAWMDEWRAFLTPYLASKQPVIVCGDLNVAHTEDDIWNAKSNAKSSGFLPHEREWFSNLLEDGWSDAFRDYVGDGEKIYSWWSNRGQARALNRGWRIDYFLLNAAAAALVENVSIDRQGGLDVSDHAPVILDLKL